MSRGNLVGIATGYGLDNRLWGPPRLPSPGVKRQGRETNHSPPTTAETKTTWICATPSRRSVKHRATLPFLLVSQVQPEGASSPLWTGSEICPVSYDGPKEAWLHSRKGRQYLERDVEYFAAPTVTSHSGTMGD
jgi:hypothetical protein